MDTLAPFRRYFRIAAIGTTIASAILTAIFAWNQGASWYVSIPIVLGLVMFSIASDYVLLFINDAWKSKRYVFTTFVALGGLLVFTINLISNVGSVGWQRESVVSAAKVQNTRYDAAQDGVAEDKASLALFKQQLADLTAANAWAATVKPDGLKAQVLDLRKAEEAEARLGGCKAKCRAIQNQITEIQGRIAVAEQATDLAKRIEATQRVLDTKRTKAASQDKAVAAPASQALFFASMFNVSLDPSEASQTWTDRGIATWLALGLCIAPMLFGMLGWRSDDDHHPQIGQAAENAGHAHSFAKPSPAPAHTTARSAYETFQAAYRREAERMGVQPLRIAA
jgi:hypothetical protein